MLKIILPVFLLSMSFHGLGQISDFDQPTDPYEHKVHHQGGEASLIRIEENEKALAMLKSKSRDYDQLLSDFASLKSELESLKAKVEALEKQK